ncbi:inorganic phosphate transporter, PiT family [Pseudomonas sp. URIL14HWK12:I9]|nr:PiT family inorganic phosphate transporter [Pseudomonas sp. URIL14HWK12:I12]PVZ25810.1 PiT family inorganic phosphate transporter [Pseudomonas sp. URIL14HWK12:I10]PVZ36666.1 PiT family inorganic phosphate transporter [Pseudomonas sp. URIL14HWK12:I11]SNZ12859.1 inorganic phosphate transporter, PiT family [Pseudomonas sp. URIL14HWK12:I9]
MTPRTRRLFAALLCIGLAVTAWGIFTDVDHSGSVAHTWLPFILLGVALVIALGFEFVNGFHDTANAVATVIYTHSLPANVAVVWSGVCNFAGVMLSSGAVAFSVVALLPVDMILQVGTGDGFIMVFALLIAAILWNLGTWWLGLPASSSHTLIGSILGVGIASALLNGRSGMEGVDWSQVLKVGYALLLSPLVGFFCAAMLLLAMRVLIKRRELYREPQGNRAPPAWIRGLLILTCSGVSFAHGSNDGQKGMGLIMLILVGTLPMAYALNRAVPATQTTQFVAVAQVTRDSLAQASLGAPVPADANQVLLEYLHSKQAPANLLPALVGVTDGIARQVRNYGTLNNVPAQAMPNVRNDMFLASESLKLMKKQGLDAGWPLATRQNVEAFTQQITEATRFIPFWVKVVVAIALGLGTLVGWKRIVITVGERIGNTHLTYAQGASAELVAMGTIGVADAFGLPVSTTHVLSSGVAGTMAASGSGLQWSTIRNLAMAWVFTLPASMLLAGGLFCLFHAIF